MLDGLGPGSGVLYCKLSACRSLGPDDRQDRQSIHGDDGEQHFPRGEQFPQLHQVDRITDTSTPVALNA